MAKKIATQEEAEQLLAETMSNRYGRRDSFKLVWTSGQPPGTDWYFRSLSPVNDRTLWRVGPRGGVTRIWSLADWQYQVLA